MKKEDNKFALINEMFDTVEIVKNFHTKDLSKAIQFIGETKKILLTGEGSSRIFPAKNVIYNTLIHTSEISFLTEGAIQSGELNLEDYTIFGASNSGKTKEVIDLFKNIKSNRKVSLTAYKNTLLGELADDEHVLNCGPEEAVAATKSVIEQALFYQSLISKYFGKDIEKIQFEKLSDKIKKVLEIKIDKDIITKISKAPTIYFAGRNNGVAEEITLKTNEITRKKSDYLEGTYLVHGIEEVMKKDDVIILINPFEKEEEKIKKVIIDGVGMNVYSISSRETIFPTIKIPEMDGFNGYIELMAGLNILVSVGLELGINLDKTNRARKIGNEN